jgi:hypothetical protein
VVLPAGRLLSTTLPLASLPPVHCAEAGEAVALQELTLLVVQLNVLLPPVTTLVELADKVTLGNEGNGVGVGVPGTVAVQPGGLPFFQPVTTWQSLQSWLVGQWLCGLTVAFVTRPP